MHKDIYRLLSSIAILVAFVFIITSDVKGQSPQHIYAGTGALVGNISPFGSSNNSRKSWIFSTSDFSPAVTAGFITDIYFRTSASPTSSTYTDLQVKMGPTTLTSFAANDPFPTASMSTVFFAASHTVNIIASGPWLKISLQTPFFWDGVTNFIVDVSRNSYTSSISIQQQTTTANLCIYGPASATTGTVANRLVEFGFDMLPGGTDAGLVDFVSLPDTICEGSTPITVNIKNHGPYTLSGATLNWSVNGILQSPFNWTGLLKVDSIKNITIGSFNFPSGGTNNIVAWVADPNGVPDTANFNDTIVKGTIFAKQAPKITLNDTLVVICQGDSAAIEMTLTGVQPWNITIDDGTNSLNYSNITTSNFSIFVSPSVSKTFTITSISDATGCINTEGTEVMVNVQSAPPAVVTAVGISVRCFGDSVTLMASVGLNLTYEWFLNGNPIPNASNYVFHAKETGDYTVKVSTSNGCSNVSPPVTVTVHPLPVVNLGNDTAVALGVKIKLDAGSGFNSYDWSTGATVQTIIVDTTGYGIGVQTIWVVVRDNNYCYGSDTISINFASNPGIAKTNDSHELSIVPNPNTGKFEIKSKNIPKGKYAVSIYDANGQLVLNKDVVIGEESQSLTIDARKLAKGVYILNLTANDSGLNRVVKLLINK